MTRAEFLRLDLKERQKYLSTMNKKQLAKLCKEYGVNDHGGTFTLYHKLVNLK